MAIAANTGTATSAAKISDINALVTAINTELALYATKTSVDELKTRVAALEAKTIPPDLTSRVAALEAKPAPVDLTARVTALEKKPAPVIPPDLTDKLATLEERQAAYEAQVGGRITVLEAETDPPDLTNRVAALEAALAALRTPAVATSTVDPMATLPTTRRPRDPSEGVELIYDKATLYYGDMELHALRTAETTWRLVAQLNYITVNQVIWTYDETIRGTPAEIYAHASARLIELAGLKTSHDAAHKRVREMSEGRP